MNAAGWFPDPTGRFAQRYFDGSDWSDQVVGANGQTTHDPMQRTASGFSPPAVSGATGAGSAPLPVPPSWSAAPPAAPSGGARLAGPLVAGVGCLLVLLSLFALDWTDGGSFGDIRDAFGDSFPDDQPFGDILSFTYVKALGILLIAVVMIGVAIVTATSSRSSNRGWRVVAALSAALAAIVHLAVVERLFRGPGPDPEIGAWLGTIGYLVAIGGLALRPGPRTGGL